MSDQQKISLLTSLSADSTPGIASRFSFNSLEKALHLSKTQMDLFLTELNKVKYVTQYAKKGVDSFTLMVTQKGLDAVEDGNFL